VLETPPVQGVPRRMYQPLPLGHDARLFTPSLPTIRRLFAKAGYNIALISRESANLHKFASELKTGDTDVRHSYFPFLSLITTNWSSFVPAASYIHLIFNTGGRVPDLQLHLQRSPNRLPRRARTLADIRHPRSALQRRLWRMEALFAGHRGRS
jgi:hypothetical protein